MSDHARPAPCPASSLVWHGDGRRKQATRAFFDSLRRVCATDGARPPPARQSPHALAVELAGPEGPWVLVGLFNLTNREDARAVALSHLPLGRMEARREAGGGGGGGTSTRVLQQRSPSDSNKEVFAFEFWRSECSRGWASSVCVHPVPPRSASLVAVRWRDPYAV